MPYSDIEAYAIYLERVEAAKQQLAADAKLGAMVRKALLTKSGAYLQRLTIGARSNKEGNGYFAAFLIGEERHSGQGDTPEAALLAAGIVEE